MKPAMEAVIVVLVLGFIGANWVGDELAKRRHQRDEERAAQNAAEEASQRSCAETCLSHVSTRIGRPAMSYGVSGNCDPRFPSRLFDRPGVRTVRNTTAMTITADFGSAGSVQVLCYFDEQGRVVDIVEVK
jgi:hypothetical protein